MPARKSSKAKKLNKPAPEDATALKTHGLYYISNYGFAGYWPVECLKDGSLHSHREDLM